MTSGPTKDQVMSECLNPNKVIVLGNCRTGMSAAMAIAIMNSKFHVVDCDGGQTRGESELEQLLNPPKVITGDMFRGLAPEEPKLVRKEKPYYRRYEKRKF